MSTHRHDSAKLGSKAAPALAVVAGVATLFYLTPLSESAVNAAAALLALGLPLLVHWPMGYRDVARAATTWTVVGLPGAYFFGVFVLLAGALTAVTLLPDARSMPRAPRS